MIAQEGEFVMETAGPGRNGADGIGRRLWPGDVIHDLVDIVAEDGDQGSGTRRNKGEDRLTGTDGGPVKRPHVEMIDDYPPGATDRRIYDLTVVIEEGAAILADEAALREMTIRRAEAIVGDIARQIVPAIADRLIREGFPAIAERMIREEIEKLTVEEEGVA